MTLLIIRHGQSEADILKVHEGRADFSLTDVGEKQADLLSAYVKNHWKVQKIYASPLRRAQAVAEKLAAATGANLTYDDDLMEWNNGILAGHAFGYIEKNYPDTDSDPAKYGIESTGDVRKRAAGVLHKIIEEHKDAGDESCVAIVTHGGMINQFYQELTGSPADSTTFFGTTDTGIHEWKITDGSTLVVHANLSSHLTDEVQAERIANEHLRVSYFAGGCFWCITPIFKMYKAKKSLCGYSGGSEVNPTYMDVKKQKTTHRETIAVEYDPEKVSYEKLVDIFLANVDPFDKDGQFIDRGHSYTLATYYTSEEEKQVAEKKIAALEASSGKKVYIALEGFRNFYEAETYHQDYYLKNPEAFEKELEESGRKKK